MSSNSAETIKLMLYWQRKALKPSQRKAPRVVSLRYPLAVEKKYAMMLRTWMKPLQDFSNDFIRKNAEELIRGDAAMELVIRCDALPGGTFTRLVDSLKGWVDIYVPDVMKQWPDDGPAIWAGLGNAAEDLNEANYKSWARSSKSAIGVEFPKDEEWWPRAKQTWMTENYTLIKKLDTEYITQINAAAEQAVVNGWSVRQLAEQISKIATTMKKSRVNLIARDQIGKLNSMATQARMQSVGLNMYIWETANDERVRSTHAPMDGLLCRWDDADKYSADGGKTWIIRPMGAVRQHPGMDYQCRCIATTYWEELMGEVDLKIAQEEGLPAPEYAAPEESPIPSLSLEAQKVLDSYQKNPFMNEDEALANKSATDAQDKALRKTLDAQLEGLPERLQNLSLDDRVLFTQVDDLLDEWDEIPDDEKPYIAQLNYTKSGDGPMNYFLRMGGEETESEFSYEPEKVETLQREIESLRNRISSQSLQTSLVAIRGQSGDIGWEGKVGDIVESPAFVSASASKQFDGDTRIIISAPAGSHALYYDDSPLTFFGDKEDEVLFNAGSKYRIDKIVQRGEGEVKKVLFVTLLE